RDNAEFSTRVRPPLAFRRQCAPGSDAAVSAYKLMHRSTTADRSPLVRLIPVCQKFIGASAGSQPPEIGKWNGPGLGCPSTARVSGVRTREIIDRTDGNIMSPLPFRRQNVRTK